MNIFKSHFWYNKRQRNGILFLGLLIIIVQLYIVFYDFSSNKTIDEKSSESLVFFHQIDSLKTIELEKRTPKIYPFNPNFITDYKGEQLGMSLEEIERLHHFRAQNKYVNSAREFQKITKISDSLLNKIAPYFKFPEWVTAKNKQYKSGAVSSKSEVILTQDKTKTNKGVIVKVNINTASFKEVLRIPGVDYELCKKIFEYRDEVAELQDISELKNIKDFPLDKYDRIVLYLEAK